MQNRQLDRARAAGVQTFAQTMTTAADELIIIDLLLPGKPDEHWIVEQASVIAGLSVRAPTLSGGFPPNTGIFLCPPSTPSESLAESVAGINLAARPFLLPLGPPGNSVATTGAAFPAGFPFAYALTLAPGFKATVPYQWFIRAIISCAQGTAAPGPGAGSRATFSALAVRESDRETGDCS